MRCVWCKRMLQFMPRDGSCGIAAKLHALEQLASCPVVGLRASAARVAVREPHPGHEAEFANEMPWAGPAPLIA